MISVASFNPRTVTPEWVREACARYAPPQRFTIQVTDWRATRYRIEITGAHRVYARNWYHDWSAGNRAVGLTCVGKTRKTRRHPELHGLPRRKYHTAWMAKHRAEVKAQQLSRPVAMPATKPLVARPAHSEAVSA